VAGEATLAEQYDVPGRGEGSEARGVAEAAPAGTTPGPAPGPAPAEGPPRDPQTGRFTSPGAGHSSTLVRLAFDLGLAPEEIDALDSRSLAKVVGDAQREQQAARRAATTEGALAGRQAPAGAAPAAASGGSAKELNDLVATTLRTDPAGPDTAMTLPPGQAELHRDRDGPSAHTAMKNLLKKNRVILHSGGYGVQWDVMVNHSGSAANVGPGGERQRQHRGHDGPGDGRLAEHDRQLRHHRPGDRHEPGAGSGSWTSSRSGAIACMISLAELMESNFWGPPVALTDTVTPWGVNTWIVKNATEGFNGGAPSGYTTIGLNPTTYPRWKNYTASTRTSPGRLRPEAAEGGDVHHFEPPVDGIPTFNTGDDYGFYTNYGVIGPLEEALESQNDNLGNDVASQDGKVVFRRVPVNWVPKLEADTTNPFYGINWGGSRRRPGGWWLKETNVPIYPGQHTISPTSWTARTSSIPTGAVLERITISSRVYHAGEARPAKAKA
jgi:hypothetical protein